ncbi:myosin-J heavy chain-like [Ylistrum balloti]|uniref:myosin-J heavy chain-like n=1 Tax=Ylistrum balloti TaxID=509963 RepID=UPI002905E50B|nr:myosin-J heavy chain-like [Ylistrum balloti]
METVEETPTKNIEERCQDYKQMILKNLAQIQRSSHDLANGYRDFHKIKRDVYNVECNDCRRKSSKILNLPLNLFSDVGCQTDYQYTVSQLSEGSLQFLNQMMNILGENDRNKHAQSRCDDYAVPSEDNTQTVGESETDEGRNLVSQNKSLQTTEMDFQSVSKENLEEQEKGQIEKATDAHDSVRTTSPHSFEVVTLDKHDEEQDFDLTKKAEIVFEQGLEKTSESEGLISNETVQGNIETRHMEQDTGPFKTETALSEQIKLLQTERNELKIKLQIEQERNETLQTALGSHDSEHKSAESPECPLDSGKECMLREKNCDRDDVEELKAKLTKATVELENLEREKTKLKEDQSTRDEEMQTLKEANRELVANMKSIHLDKHNILKELDKVKAEMAQKESELKESLEEKSTRDEEMQTLKEANRELVANMKSIHLDKHNILKELDKVKAEMAQKESELKESLEEKSTRDEEMQTLKEANRELVANMKSIHLDKHNILKELDKVKAEMAQKESELKESLEEKSTRDEEMQTLKEANRELVANMKSIHQDKHNILKELDKVKAEMAQKESELKESLEEKSTRDEEIRTLREANSELVANMKSVHQDKQYLLKKLDKVKAEMAQKESELKESLEEKIKCDGELQSLKAKVSEADSHLKRNEQEKHNYLSQLDKVKAEMMESKSAMENIRDENRKMKENQQKNEQIIQAVQSEKDKLDSQCKDLQLENVKMKETMNVRLEEKNNKFDKVTKENMQLKAYCSKHDKELSLLRASKREMDSQLESIKKEKEIIQNKLVDVTAAMTRTKSESDKAQREVQKLTNISSLTNERLQNLKQSHYKLDLEKENLQQQNAKIGQSLDEEKVKLTNVKKELEKTQEENCRLKVDSETKSKQLDALSSPKKKHVVLGLRSERSGLGKSVVDMVTRELTRRLQERLDMRKLNLAVSFSSNPSEVTNGLQIVLCLNMSRVGTNIADTLKGMKADRDVFVMVLHHTSKENLSSLTPTSHRVTGSEIRQLGGIFDMAFSGDGGLYECDLNNSAVEKIASILRKCLIL